MTHDELLAALKSATGPDRELDALVLISADRKRAIRWYWTGATGMPRDLPYDWNLLQGGLGSQSIRTMAPAYTASLDAALTLVPESASSWDCGRIDKDFLASVEFPVDVDGFHNYMAKSMASAAIALCIAALKARAGQQSQTEHSAAPSPNSPTPTTAEEEKEGG